ncbi:hypothetical protein [Bradyrhizobium paxllaeri]|uniref:hypothetical protein n=1 Tax=Bradyrhizobium paxllaeri TaxID=190148 RepID=UPI00114654D8|nr:hypothetical protein [Bradyrhizobium paxllaeri]
MGVAVMRFMSNLTPATSGLILVALLVLGAVVVQHVGPAEKGGVVIRASEHDEGRTRTTVGNGDWVTPDIGGVKGLRGSLP